MSERKLIDDVREQYAGVAKGGLSNDSDSIRSIASAFGYSEEELNQLPAEANMGLSCGNPLALAEILRVLKPGGRVALSDIGLKQELPSDVKQSVEAYVGCISGAILIDEYRSLLEQAGFDAVVVTDTGADLNAYALASDGGCCGEVACCSGTAESTADAEQKSLHAGLATVMQSFDANAYAASVRVHAMKKTSAHKVTTIPVLNLQPISKEKTMKCVQVYDKPMCCSTGVCGPDVDPVLPKFAADLDWLKNQGHPVERFNLAQQPQAFIENKAIHGLLSTAGTDCLPVVVVDGEIVSQAVYPSREDLAGWVEGAPTKQGLPVTKSDDGCCSSTGCC